MQSHHALIVFVLVCLLFCDNDKDRALQLTTLCLRLNPANYTVWHFRRQCLVSLELQDDQETIESDLSMAAVLGGSNPKNYQIWYHRRAVLEACTNEIFQNFVHGELNYIADVVKEDGKNYHAWSHRQWIIKTMDDEQLWDMELDFGRLLSVICLCVCERERIVAEQKNLICERVREREHERSRCTRPKYNNISSPYFHFFS
jgi:hypothetical protein